MKKNDSAYRSLVAKENWIQKKCERCDVDFWVTPAQSKLRFCSSECRHEPWEVRLWKNVVKGKNPEDCWTFKLKSNADGYPYLKKNGVATKVSRLMWEIHHGEIQDGLVVRHKKCNNPACVNIAHLLIGTQGQNVQDRVESNRSAHNLGEASGTSKLTDEKVIQIKSNPDGLLQKQLAKKFGVSDSQISGIVKGHMWPHVSPDLPIRKEHGNATLSDDQVREIRSLKGSMIQKDVATKFGVGAPMISQIWSGKRRKDVDDAPNSGIHQNPS